MKDIDEKILQHVYQTLYGIEEGSKIYNRNIRKQTHSVNFKKKKKVSFKEHVEYSRN